MRHDDPITRHDIARNTGGILAAGIFTAVISGAAGFLIELLSNPAAPLHALAGWAVMGVVLFGFPIIMGLIGMRQR
jgi:hypothetical protein